MGFIWRPLGLIATSGGLLAWGLALLVFLIGTERRSNRRLAAALFVDGAFFLGFIGLPYFTDDASVATALVVVGEMAMMCSAWFYLSFLGTLETPLTRPFRRAGPWIAVIVSGTMVTLYQLWVNALPREAISDEELGLGFLPWALGVVTDDPASAAAMGRYALVFSIALLAMLLTSLFGIIASMHAWLRASPESPARRRNRLMAGAFAIRDAGILVGFGGLLLSSVVSADIADHSAAWLGALLNTPMLAEVFFVPVAVYAMVRTQMLHIELRVKRAIPPGFVVFLGTVGFLVVSEIIESLLTRNAGLIAGVATATAVGIAAMPLQRLGKRVAQRWLPGVEETDKYMVARKQEVYRDAFEAVIQDGVIRPHERVALAKLAERLDIEDTVARGIEDTILPPIRMPAALP